MQRSYPLRWLALAIGLLATQCLDSISDDCTKTLTCDDQQPTLQANCEWRYPDGRLWLGGPKRDSATGRWRWPDGKETDTQDFKCSVVDAGADAGLTGPDCRRNAPCDSPQVCDQATGACVECLDDSECSGHVAVGDAGAAVVCDKARHLCVPCLINDNCTPTGNRLICKHDAADSTRNECVECQIDRECNSGANPICDEASNECTSHCTGPNECSGEKRFCNLQRQLCVECLGATDCAGNTTKSQCNLAKNECVECVDDAPCGAGEVCDTTRNVCVQCRDDVQCTSNSNGPHCDPRTNLCVQCLDDTQCSSNASSRCNTANHLCVGCTADMQCENGLLCNTLLGSGTCVQCRDSNDCTVGLNRTCETALGRCVECLSTSTCTRFDTSHCQTVPSEDPLKPLYSCVGCEGNLDCGGKNVPGLCNTVSGDCVNCVDGGDCAQSPLLSRCAAGGNCAVCSNNEECSLFAGADRGSLKVCKENQGCVQCVADGDCSSTPATSHCKVSNANAAMGNAAINTCVECTSNAQCTNPAKAVCSNNQCVPCTTDNECAQSSNGATALHVCDAGTCVQCTGPKRAACGTNVCNSLTKACTAFPVGSADLCETCVSDAQCVTSARCVQLTVGTSSVYSCFPLATGTPSTCSDRVFFGINQSTTIDIQQSPPATCVLRRTTCEGYRDYEALSECAQDSDCGATGVADGICQAGQCTVPCDSSNDCPAVCEAAGFCRL